MANIERLTQLRRVVEAAPAHLFVMNDIETYLCDGQSCGTAYCAYGWATQDAWFKADGIPEHLGGANRVDLFTALARYFDLTQGDTDDLFGGDFDLDEPDEGYMTDKAPVLANIDLLIAGKPAVPYPGTFGY